MNPKLLIYSSICIIYSISFSIAYSQNANDEFSLYHQGQEKTVENVLSEYIQIESISGSERWAGDFLKNLCSENGLNITQMGDQDGNYNFAASIGPLSDNLPNIIFLNHIDVIGEGPPEISSLLHSDSYENVFGISVAHKRIFWTKLEAKVETLGHGSVTPFQYANKEMVLALNRITEYKPKARFNDLNVSILRQIGHLEKGLMSVILKHPRLFRFFVIPQLRMHPELFALFSNTITVTSIDSDNEVVNVMPDKVTALLDCRLLPQQSQEDFLNHLKKTLNNDLIKITVINDMPEMKPSSSNSVFYQNLEKVILNSYPNSHVLEVLIPNCNDAGIFRSNGVPSFSCIPVKMDVKKCFEQ